MVGKVKKPTKKAGKKTKAPKPPPVPTTSFDIILTISDMWLLPYLEHCIASLQRQNYPSRLYRIHVSYYRKDDSEDASGLLKLCQQANAVLSFGTWHDKVFSIARAYNLSARLACRDAVAFLDSDIVFHPSMLAHADLIMRKNKALVVDVGRSQLRPTSEIVAPPYDALWAPGVQKKLRFHQYGIGNIIVPRPIVERLRGYDERYYGWGAIDSDFYARVKKVCTVKRTYQILPLGVHLLHPQNPTKHTRCTARNRKLWRQGGQIKRNFRGWGGAK